MHLICCTKLFFNTIPRGVRASDRLVVFQNAVTAEMRFCPSQPFMKSQFHVRIIAELRLLPNICFSSTKLFVAHMLLSYLFLIWWVRAPPNKAMHCSIEQNGTVTPSHVQWPRHPVHQFFVCHQPLCCVPVLFVCVCRVPWAADGLSSSETVTAHEMGL
jgi:hypothetical protein